MWLCKNKMTGQEREKNLFLNDGDFLGALFSCNWFVENTIEVFFHFRPDLITFTSVKFLKNALFAIRKEEKNIENIFVFLSNKQIYV